jgi:hypothetical protein
VFLLPLYPSVLHPRGVPSEVAGRPFIKPSFWGVRYVSGLQRRLESRSWQKAGDPARQLAGGGFPGAGRSNHSPGGDREARAEPTR